MRRPYRATLAQTEGGASHMRRRDIGNQGITGSTAYPFHDPTQQPGCQHKADRRGQREQRFGQCAQSVAQHGKPFSLAEIVAERPEKTLTISAVDSARPSTKPTAKALAPKVETMNNGSKLWIILEEMSISMLTKPSTQMLAGI